jgi:hypothetical protein
MKAKHQPPAWLKKERDRARMKRARAVARERGGRLVSKYVPRVTDRARWECVRRHQWDATMANVVNSGTWCPWCGRHNIDEMQRLAANLGGKCLSTNYVTVGEKLQWQCAAGHKFWSLPALVLHGRWCPACAGRQRLGLQELRRVARLKGGRLLSASYVDSSTPLLWQCARGHTWWAAPGGVKPGKYDPGNWCRRCHTLSRTGRPRRSWTLEDMRKIARERGGKCLSRSYVNYTTKLKWRCDRGHEWMADGASVWAHWCHVCGRGPNYDRAAATAARQGGKVLTPHAKVKRGSSRVLMQCAVGHRWKDTITRITTGGWCPECKRKAPLNLKHMQNLARSRGGQCLAKRYVDRETPLLWRCGKGHVWEATPTIVLRRFGRGNWCPDCERKESSSRIRRAKRRP